MTSRNKVDTLNLVSNIFFDLTVIICIAAFLSLIFKFFRQPEILAYILTGIVISSFHVFSSSNRELLEALSALGVTLLLFMVGLEIKVSELLTIGKSLLIASVGQILITFDLAFLLSILFQYDLLTSAYIAAALTFSSTIIVVKLLSDQRELHSLHAKFSLGILLAQDILAIICLMILSGFNKSTGDILSSSGLILIVLKGITLILLITFLSKRVFPKILNFVARSSETLFLTSLAWVFGLAAIVSSKFIGFSVEIGGFLAGVALANSIVNYQIIARAKTLRDFFIVIFFVLLGLQMSFENIYQIILPAIVLSLFVLFLKPFIVMMMLGSLGYKKRTAFLTGVSLSQISEFSLILAFLGLRLGHINQSAVSLITLVGLITFAFSTYSITHWKSLYKRFSDSLSFIESKKSSKNKTVLIESNMEGIKDHIVIVGGDEMGQSILEALLGTDSEIVVIDFDPTVVKDFINKRDNNVHILFGDIADLDIQQKANINEAKIVISTVPDLEDNLILLRELKHENRSAKIIMMAHDLRDAKILYEDGADYVMMPHFIGGSHIAKIILEDDKLEVLEEYKKKDLEKFSS